MTLRHLDLEALKATPVTRKPFEYFVVPGFVRPEARAKINADYPKISEGGSFPVAQLSYGPAFREFVAELESDDFREAFEEKFGLDLGGPADHDDGSGPVQPKRWAHPYRYEKQDHHRPHLHEPRLGEFRRPLATPEIG